MKCLYNGVLETAENTVELELKPPFACESNSLLSLKAMWDKCVVKYLLFTRAITQKTLVG